jgi:hypothetical protein
MVRLNAMLMPGLFSILRVGNWCDIVELGFQGEEEAISWRHLIAKDAHSQVFSSIFASK